ncbi:slit homolog 1 protein-like [Belonocnema kinseyi]|uniref:slit homolog 1 protein-like n=1 Tax=Belonocnema kinseyi TaxID=2817044 RepID=UPI00143D708F|nr:slit homolog 1 protein-like [Belonocnema kinseyi]
MFVFPIFLLQSLVVGTEVINSNILDIENGMLNRIISEDPLIETLDLSGMQIRSIRREAFNNLKTLKTLNLRNNSLKALPEFIFSNLNNLEYLSLSENEIISLDKVFVGLDNLKALNISYLPKSSINPGEFLGLPTNVTIYIRGNKLNSINLLLFENASLLEENKIEASGSKTNYTNIFNHTVTRDSYNLTEVCIDNGIVVNIKEAQKVDLHCEKMKFIHKDNLIWMDLSELGIKGFGESWYHLQNVAVISLSANEIENISKDLLNELPVDVLEVMLDENKIKKLHSKVIKNKHIKLLNLSKNLIGEIEDRTFEHTKLETLYLLLNRLENMNFVRTLPSSLKTLNLGTNKFKSIPSGVFRSLSNLEELLLSKNQITTLQADVFSGLNSLKLLELWSNRISYIAPGSFRNLRSLNSLYLSGNSIYFLSNGILENMEELTEIHLDENKIRKIRKGTFNQLCKSLTNLNIESNQLDSIEPGSFVNMPKLTYLSLRNNFLTVIKSGTFRGLFYLTDLSISHNPISIIEKNSFSNVSTLLYFALDMTSTHLKKLETGIFSGLPTSTNLQVENNQIEVIKPGALVV